MKKLTGIILTLTASVALGACATPSSIVDEPVAAVVVKTKTPEPIPIAIEEEETVEETASERAGPLVLTGWSWDIGRLEDHQLLYADGEVAALEMLFTVHEEPYIVRAVRENGPFESTWRNLDEFVNIIERSDYDEQRIGANFLTHEADDINYVIQIKFYDDRIQDALFDALPIQGSMSIANLYAGSNSGPVLPEPPLVDGSKYAYSPTVQKRIMYLLGTCTDEEPNWTHGSELDLLVKYRNFGEGRLHNSQLIYSWITLAIKNKHDFGDDFTPYGGYCDGDMPVDVVPEDEVEGYRFVDSESGDDVIIVEPRKVPENPIMRLWN